MKAKYLIFLVIISLISLKARGQDENHRFIFLEGSFNGIGCDTPDKDYIRPVNDQSSGYYSDQIKALMEMNFVGVRYEYRVLKNRLGLSAGLRYSRLVSSIGRDSYLSSGPDYFYMKYKQTALETDFAKVCEINQKGDYLGIPVEFRVYPKYIGKIFTLFFKAGASYNFKIRSKSDIEFFSPSMVQYKGEVLKVIEKPSPNFTTFHIGFGMKLGRSEKPGIAIETYTPLGVKFPKGSYLVKPLSGSGIQLTLSLPLSNTKK
jgi:hypothetical protein